MISRAFCHLFNPSAIVETGSVDAYKHNMSLQKRLMALRVLIADMTKKKEEVEKQIKELSNVRLD